MQLVRWKEDRRHVHRRAWLGGPQRGSLRGDQWRGREDEVSLFISALAGLTRTFSLRELSHEMEPVGWTHLVNVQILVSRLMYSFGEQAARLSLSPKKNSFHVACIGARRESPLQESAALAAFGMLLSVPSVGVRSPVPSCSLYRR